MSPPLKNIVTIRSMRIVRWPNDPARDNPYAHSTLTTMEMAVPTTVIPRLTSSECITS